MDVQLTPDQQAFARQAMAAGRIGDESEAVQEALQLWERRERTRLELLAAVDLAEASLRRGEGRVIDEEAMSALAVDVKQRGRARMLAKQTHG